MKLIDTKTMVLYTVVKSRKNKDLKVGDTFFRQQTTLRDAVYIIRDNKIVVKRYWHKMYEVEVV